MIIFVEMACGKAASIDVLPSDSDSEESDESETETTSNVPTPAAISRRRAIPKNTSSTPVAVRGERKLKNKSILERVKEFPEDFLERRDGDLFCGVCSEVLSQKKSSVKKHCESKKHKNSVLRRNAERKKQVSIAEALRKRDEQRLVGESLPTNQRVHRFHVTELFLKAGIPLSKVDTLRPVLENKYRITSPSHLRELIPAILEEEQLQIVAEIKGRQISLIFDGTTRLGEAIGIVARFVDKEWNIQQRLIRLHTVAKPVNAPQLAQVINQCIATKLQHPAELIIAFMRDGASVNSAAVRALSVFYPNSLDVVCFSHTINNVGHRFVFPLLQEFTRLWISLFAHSARVKLAWKERTGTSMRSHSETRWWSKWELLSQVSLYFGDVAPFLQQLPDVSASTTQQLLAIIQHPERSRQLRLELAAVVDVGKHFVSATYALEGDGPLVFRCYSHLQAIASAMAQKDFTNLKAVARQIAQDEADLTAPQLVAETMRGVEPAIAWFLGKFNVELEPVVTAFRRARFFDPVAVQSLGLTSQKVQSLRCFPFYSDEELGQMVDELPQYLAAVTDVTLDTPEEKWSWWSHQNNIPHWKSAVMKLVLVQPSSAAVERVFSILTSCFTDEQRSSLEETIEASVMLRYNDRK